MVIGLGADGAFSLLAFSDPALDETLAEIHDKNMFDEHLGLKKEVDGDIRDEHTQPQAKAELQSTKEVSKIDRASK